jgi:hypothetical protein
MITDKFFNELVDLVAQHLEAPDDSKKAAIIKLIEDAQSSRIKELEEALSDAESLISIITSRMQLAGGKYRVYTVTRQSNRSKVVASIDLLEND